jgi:hypothetical protein
MLVRSQPVYDRLRRTADQQCLTRTATQIYLEAQQGRQKNPRIVISDSFQCSAIVQKADFAITQSLFSHLPPNLIHLCFQSLYPWLTDDGVFFATYFEVKNTRKNASKPHDHGYFAYTKAKMAEFGEANRFSVHYIGDWHHPRNQVMVEYRKSWSFWCALTQWSEVAEPGLNLAVVHDRLQKH